MQTDLLSLADYLHAFQVVLQRLPHAHPERRTEQVCAEASTILRRVAAARLRLGLGAVGQAELAGLSGHCLPPRVVVWLAECGRRLAAGESAPLAAHILDLCRALEWLLVARERLPDGVHLRIADLDGGVSGVAGRQTDAFDLLGRAHLPAASSILAAYRPQPGNGRNIH